MTLKFGTSLIGKILLVLVLALVGPMAMLQPYTMLGVRPVFDSLLTTGAVLSAFVTGSLGFWLVFLAGREK